MDPHGFLTDLEQKPEVLGRLADLVEADDWGPPLPEKVARVLLLGMGSSTYAAGVAAARMRAAGIDAVCELASSDTLPPARPDQLVVPISASGGSRETLTALRHYAGSAPVLAMTNVPGSAVTEMADAVWLLAAGPELGGVACRSFQHTLVALMGLELRLSGRHDALADLVRRAATACAHLLDRRREWLPEVCRLLDSPQMTACVSPARRLASAQQAALMMREGPRRVAVGCETGDWSHVDVYLTKSTDYRMLLFPGSPYEDELLRWTGERGSTVVAVGDDIEQAAVSVRYPGDDDGDVRLLSEVLVAELVAQQWWQRG